jgi:hypothetical protein
MELYLHIYSAIQEQNWQLRRRNLEVCSAFQHRADDNSAPLGPCGLAPMSGRFEEYAG